MLKSKAKLANKVKNPFNPQFYSIVKFNLFLLKKSISFWILTFLLLFSQPITLIAFFIIDLDLLNFSFIFSIVSVIISLIWLIFLINKLFSENKTNSIDVIMFSKPISKYGLFFSRMIIIFSFLVMIMFAQFLISSIFVLSFSYDAQWIIYLLISNLFITPIIFSILAALLVLLAIVLKPLWFGVSSFLVVLLVGFAPVLSRTLQNNNFDNTILYNNDNYNSFSKLTIVDQDHNQTFLVDEINHESQHKIDTNILQTLNNTPFYQSLIPGELLLSMNSSLLNDLNFQNSKIDSNYSLIKTQFIDISMHNINFANKYLFSTRPEDISPLDMNNVEYQNLLIDNITKIVNQGTQFINLNDEKIIDLLYNKLSNSIDWKSNSLSESEFLTIRALLGIDINFSQLFYYFNNQDLLAIKAPDIMTQIELLFNPSLVKLLSFLWTSDIAQMNVFDLGSFGDINLLYPSAKSKNLVDLPDAKDVAFIKNDLIRFSGTAIHYLDLNKQYVSTTIEKLKEISPSIIDKKTWNDFVDASTFTLDKAIELNAKLNTSLTNIFKMNFRENSSSIAKYSYFMEMKNTTYLNNIYLPILSIIFVTVGLNILTIYIFKKKNYKN